MHSPPMSTLLDTGTKSLSCYAAAAATEALASLCVDVAGAVALLPEPNHNPDGTKPRFYPIR